MIFTLDDKPVLSPKVMREECERLGYSTEQWLGKANCFVDRYGAYPSYGYFLVDWEIIQIANTLKDITPQYVAITGSNKFTLKMQLDDGTIRTVNDMYVQEWVNITPSLLPENSYYLIKLVDARYVFTKHETSEGGIYSEPRLQWWNKVITYMSPEELKYEFELDTVPEFGEFIYDEETVQEPNSADAEYIEIGSRDGSPVNIPKALTWEEIFQNFFLIFCDSSRADIDPVFPYFEKNNYTLTLNFLDELPSWTPQDICTKYKTAADVLDQLLFWSGMTLSYAGYGVFNFVRADNNDVLTSNELDNYLNSLIPHHVVHDGITSAGNVVPHNFIFHQRIIPTERDDNEKQEYKITPWEVDQLDAEGLPINQKDVPLCSRNSINVLVPLSWCNARSSVSNQIHPEDAAPNYNLELHQVIEDYCHRLPSDEKDYSFYGFVNIVPKSFLERVTWYDLGDGPVTRIESIIEKDWNKYAPMPIIPRELKLSIIIAKVDGNVDGEDTTFAFKEPRLLIGQLFPTNTAYNTVKRSYIDGEEVILVGGNIEDWRHKSLLIENYEYDQLYFTIDDVPYLRLKVLKADLLPLDSEWQWRVELTKVALINGKIPYPDEVEDEQDYIYIKNTPRIVLDDNDAFIYIGYDITAGSDIYHRWTVSDPQNDLLFLKGLPGYIQNPTEPIEGERRLVLKSPYSNTQPIGWLEEAADGRTDEELEQFIINIFEEQGGGGGEGGNTTMMVATVNKAGGVAATDATFPFNNATVLVSDGAVLPDSGSCDNTFSTPFVHTEKFLLLKKNNGVWTAIKIRRNLIRATPATSTRPGTAVNLGAVTAIVGTAPDGTPQAVADEAGYMQGEPLLFEQTDDNKWRCLRRIETTALFRTTSAISAGTWNTSGSFLTYGTGNARKLIEDPAIDGRFILDGGSTVIKNMGPLVAASKTIQAKKIGRYWWVDVEACT